MGLRRGDARQRVGAPRHNPVARWRARLVHEEQRDARRLRAAAPSRVRRAIIVGGARFGARRARFEPVWNRTLFTAVSARAGIPVFAVGGIRTAAECNEIVDSGAAAMVGIGRPFYAEPDLAARVLAADASPRFCVNSNRCVPAQMLGMKGICYNPDVRRRRTEP